VRGTGRPAFAPQRIFSNSLQQDWRLGLPGASVLAGRRSPAWLQIRGALFRLRRDLSRLVYAIWLAMSSSVGRILLLRSMLAGQPVLVIGEGPAIGPIGLPNKRTNTRSRDIQLLLETYPWATMADLHLFLLGWNKGEEFAGRGSGSEYFRSTQTGAKP